MPILKQCQIVEKKEGLVNCLDITKVEKTSTNEIIHDLVPKLVYGDKDINWKYAIGGRINNNKLEFSEYGY